MDIEIKRGDQLMLDLTRTDAGGNPVDLTGVTVSSQAKITGFVAPLTVTVTNAALGQFRLSATAAATAAWPISLLAVDVKFDGGGGNIRRSKTFGLKVVQEITS